MTGLCFWTILLNTTLFGLGILLWNLRTGEATKLNTKSRNKLLLFAALSGLGYCLSRWLIPLLLGPG